MGLSKHIHETLDPDPMMRIGIRIQRPLRASTRLRSGSDLRTCAVWQCSWIVREIQSSSAIRVVSVPCETQARLHWIRIVDPSGLGESGFSARVESPNDWYTTDLWFKTSVRNLDLSPVLYIDSIMSQIGLLINLWVRPLYLKARWTLLWRHI